MGLWAQFKFKVSKKMVKIQHLFSLLTVTICIILVFNTIIQPVSSKGQYVQPLNMGMQMAIPYDIANIFNRPIAGVTAVILTVGLGLIMFFGIITAPFGYFFGIPSRKYVTGGGTPEKPMPRSMPSLSLPDFDFTNNIFYFMPDEAMDSVSCRSFVICFAHGTLKHLPVQGIKLYKYFR